MSQEGIYLIKVAEWFGYCNRYSTIEQVGNRTGTRCGFVPTLDGRSQMYFYIGLYLCLTLAKHITVRGGPKCMHVHYITSPKLNFPVKFSFNIFSF